MNMFTFLVGISTLTIALPYKEAAHQDTNPLYKSLLDPGLPVGPDLKTKLPAPTMPDGLDAAKQKAIITGLLGSEYSYGEFTRKSIVAPQLMKLRDATPSDPRAPARGVDVWFIAYGSLKSLEDETFLDRLVNAGKGDGSGKSLTKAELDKRKIAVPDPKREAFGHIEFDFLEKVHLKATGRAMWTRTEDSVLVAAEIDPRFQNDADYPNQWRSIVKERGSAKLGPATPWGGAGLYLKITKLAEPAGALFVEQHIVFSEPTGWFDGANLLRSKLPIAVQVNVRAMRKEWAKGPGK